MSPNEAKMNLKTLAKIQQERKEGMHDDIYHQLRSKYRLWRHSIKTTIKN